MIAQLLDWVLILKLSIRILGGSLSFRDLLWISFILSFSHLSVLWLYNYLLVYWKFGCVCFLFFLRFNLSQYYLISGSRRILTWACATTRLRSPRMTALNAGGKASSPGAPSLCGFPLPKKHDVRTHMQNKKALMRENWIYLSNLPQAHSGSELFFWLYLSISLRFFRFFLISLFRRIYFRIIGIFLLDLF